MVNPCDRRVYRENKKWLRKLNYELKNAKVDESSSIEMIEKAVRLWGKRLSIVATMISIKPTPRNIKDLKLYKIHFQIMFLSDLLLSKRLEERKAKGDVKVVDNRSCR